MSFGIYKWNFQNDARCRIGKGNTFRRKGIGRSYGNEKHEAKEIAGLCSGCPKRPSSLCGVIISEYEYVLVSQILSMLQGHSLDSAGSPKCQIWGHTLSNVRGISGYGAIPSSHHLAIDDTVNFKFD